MILINKDTHIPNLTPYKEYDINAIDKEIKSLEHIREMLIDFFGKKIRQQLFPNLGTMCTID